METIERDETLPIGDEVADKLNRAVKETDELQKLAETNVIPFKSVPARTYPPAPRPKIAKGVTKYVNEVHSEFLSSIADKKDLRIALAKSENKRAQELLISLLDPRKAKISSAQLVQRSGLQTLELLDILRDHYIGSGLQEYLKGFQEIAQDTVEDAKSSSHECHKCSGEGMIEDKKAVKAGKGDKAKNGKDGPVPLKTCTACSGTGLIRKSGDPDARKLIAQSLKLIQSGSGPNVNVSIQNSNHRSFECVIDEVERNDATRRRPGTDAKTDIIDLEPA